MGLYPTLRKPKSRVDDLASVVCQEFYVVKGGEGPRHGDRGRPGVLGAPLRFAVHGKKQVACRSGQPILTPVAAIFVGCCIRRRGQPDDHNSARVRAACRPPIRNGTTGTTVTGDIRWRDSRLTFRCHVYRLLAR